MKCRDCFENLFKKCEDAYKKRISEEENHFETITKGLKESMVNSFLKIAIHLLK